MKQSESLLGHLLPEPSHPRVKFRVAATTTLLLFASYVAFQALGPTQEASDVGLGWRNYQDVSWGRGKDDFGQLETEFGAESSSAEEGDKADDWGSSDTAADVDNPSSPTPPPAAFPKAQAQKVERLLLSGALSSYSWHATLDNLTTTADLEKRWWGSKEVEEIARPEGRLIVVGDVHGMVASLTSLLDRISYNSSVDTLLFVGDLVAKSTVNSSLESVSLLRQHGAKGVRGNHDQGILEWRRWMESYGPLGRDAEGGASNTGVHRTKQGWTGDVAEEEPQADERRRTNSKRWWWNSPAENEEQAEEEAAADAEEGLEQGEEAEEGSGQGREAEAESKTEVKTTSATSSEEESTPSTTAEDSDSTEDNTSEETSAVEMLPTSISTARRRPHARPTSTFAPPSPDSTSITPSSTSPSLASSTSSSSSISQSSGTLTGSGWEWLDLSADEVQKLNVQIPHHWEWGSEWFKLARHLPQEDADFIGDLPLTLWIEELRTYIVHAGMLPWSSISDDFEKFSTEPLAPRPSLFTSTSLRLFSPSATDSELLTSSERALLLVQQNEDPFTLLSMRTLHAARKTKGNKGAAGGRKVSKGKNGTPWSTVWDKSMRECDQLEGCEVVNSVYGHNAAADLTIKQNSIGLDSGCVYGRRLSALVLPKSSSNSEFPSPLKTEPSSTSSFATPSPNGADSASSFTTSTGKVISNPFAGLGAAGRPDEDRGRMVRRAAPPPSADGGWMKRPGVEGWTEDKPVSTIEAEEKPTEEDGEVADAVSVATDAGVEEDEEFGDKQVTFAGREGWIVSIDCAPEKERMDKAQP